MKGGLVAIKEASNIFLLCWDMYFCEKLTEIELINLFFRKNVERDPAFYDERKNSHGLE